MRWQGLVFAVVCAFWLLCLPLAAWLAGMGMSARYQGGALGKASLFFAVAALPLACLLAPLAAWIARKKGLLRASWWILAIPLALVMTATVALMAARAPSQGRALAANGRASAGYTDAALGEGMFS